MFKDPLAYRLEDIPEIMNIPIILEMIKSNKIIRGVIVGYGEVSESSTLPIFIKVENHKGEINCFNLFNVKSIKNAE